MMEPTLKSEAQEALTESSSLLKSHLDLLRSEYVVENSLEDAQGGLYATLLLGTPLAAFYDNWTQSLWTYLGLTVAGPALCGILHSSLQAILPWFSNNKMGGILANVLAVVAFGFALAYTFQTTLVVMALVATALTVFFVTNLNAQRNRSQRLDLLKFSPRLIDEMLQLELDGLNLWVRTSIERVFLTRQELRQTLDDSLSQDILASTDVLRAVDLVIAGMLNRALPLSGLLNRDPNENTSPAQTAKASFERMEKSIDGVSIGVMEYASRPDQDALSGLRELINEIAVAELAQKEIFIDVEGGDL